MSHFYVEFFKYNQKYETVSETLHFHLLTESA